MQNPSHPWHGSPVGCDKPWQVWAFMDFRHEALDLPEESGKRGTEVETFEVLFWMYKSVRFCGKLIAKVLFGQIKVRQDDSKRWRSFWSLYVDPEHRWNFSKTCLLPACHLS